LSSPRLSPQTRLTIPIAKNAKNQAKSSQFRTRFSPFATPANHSNTKLPNSKKTQKSRKIKPIPNEVLSSPRLSTITKNAKIKQNQANFERGSVLAMPVTPGIQIAKKCEKSSKVKPILNKVFALRYT
jgi:hypothetical protein